VFGTDSCPILNLFQRNGFAYRGKNNRWNYDTESTDLARYYLEKAARWG